jgi:hypothetical protein
VQRALVQGSTQTRVEMNIGLGRFVSQMRFYRKQGATYMHANPVKEKLVHHPGDWPWSSWCHYYGRHALLVMDAWERSAQRVAQLKRETLYQGEERAHSLQRTQRVGHPPSHASM